VGQVGLEERRQRRRGLSRAAIAWARCAGDGRVDGVATALPHSQAGLCRPRVLGGHPAAPAGCQLALDAQACPVSRRTSHASPVEQHAAVHPRIGPGHRLRL
jgi:hypothetical protein